MSALDITLTSSPLASVVGIWAVSTIQYFVLWKRDWNEGRDWDEFQRLSEELITTVALSADLDQINKENNLNSH